MCYNHPARGHYSCVRQSYVTVCYIKCAPGTHIDRQENHSPGKGYSIRKVEIEVGSMDCWCLRAVEAVWVIEGVTSIWHMTSPWEQSAEYGGLYTPTDYLPVSRQRALFRTQYTSTAKQKVIPWLYTPLHQDSHPSHCQRKAVDSRSMHNECTGVVYRHWPLSRAGLWDPQWTPCHPAARGWCTLHRHLKHTHNPHQLHTHYNPFCRVWEKEVQV